MERIWKYQLEITDEQSLVMPKEAKPLFVDFQNDELCLWLRCDEDNERVLHKIVIYGTGHPIFNINEKYVGSVIDPDEMLVWHVYDGGEIG